MCVAASRRFRAMHHEFQVTLHTAQVLRICTAPATGNGLLLGASGKTHIQTDGSFFCSSRCIELRGNAAPALLYAI